LPGCPPRCKTVRAVRTRHLFIYICINRYTEIEIDIYIGHAVTCTDRTGSRVIARVPPRRIVRGVRTKRSPGRQVPGWRKKYSLRKKKSQTVYNTQGPRAHTHMELNREWPWEPEGSAHVYIYVLTDIIDTHIFTYMGRNGRLAARFRAGGKGSPYRKRCILIT